MIAKNQIRRTDITKITCFKDTEAWQIERDLFQIIYATVRKKKFLELIA
jgi:hypothetical protein